MKQCENFLVESQAPNRRVSDIDSVTCDIAQPFASKSDSM